MLVVGITGGIGSGKTTAADRFAELGITVIDADIVARQVVQPGKPALQEIKETFGMQVIGSDGHLNRSALRQVVFSDYEMKKKLENILHPRIHKEIISQLDQLVSNYAIIVIPLLAEGKRNYPLDRVLVIDAPAELQLNRVSARDQQSISQVKRILDSQATREERNSMSDDIIENTGSLEDLHENINRLHLQYLELAKKKKGVRNNLSKKN